MAATTDKKRLRDDTFDQVDGMVRAGDAHPSIQFNEGQLRLMAKVQQRAEAKAAKEAAQARSKRAQAVFDYVLKHDNDLHHLALGLRAYFCIRDTIGSKVTHIGAAGNYFLEPKKNRGALIVAEAKRQLRGVHSCDHACCKAETLSEKQERLFKFATDNNIPL